MDKLKVFEAFSGYGSQSIALRNLGIPHEVVAISEIDKYAIKAYEAIHGSALNLGDISKIKVEDVPQHDLFTYSFPCQDLSVAGKQAGLGEGTRSGLLYECEKIIEYCRPKYLLLENVKNLVGKKFKPQFDEWLDYLESLGYTNYWKVLNAKNYGIPQNRERVFIVSIRKDIDNGFEFPKAVPLQLRLKDMLDDEVDEKYYLSKEQIDRINNSNFMQEKKRLQEKDYVDTLLARDYKDPKCVKVEPKRIRKITPKECWRLMGFDDEDFEKVEKFTSNTQLYKQAGNSVCVNVIEHIFSKLNEFGYISKLR